jgi:hypothetical protein
VTPVALTSLIGPTPGTVGTVVDVVVLATFVVGARVDFVGVFGVACDEELPHAAATSTSASAANAPRGAFQTLPRRVGLVSRALIPTTSVGQPKPQDYVSEFQHGIRGERR